MQSTPDNQNTPTPSQETLQLQLEECKKIIEEQEKLIHITLQNLAQPQLTSPPPSPKAAASTTATNTDTNSDGKTENISTAQKAHLPNFIPRTPPQTPPHIANSKVYDDGDSRIELASRLLDMERKLFEEQKRNFDEERKLFTEASVQLAKERMELQVCLFIK